MIPPKVNGYRIARKAQSRRWRPRLLALMSPLLATGCTVGPDYHSPQMAVPAGWSQADGSVLQTSATQTNAAEASLSRWWSGFGDATLDGLVQQAMESNLDLRIAAARIREVRAQRGIVAADGLPGVDVAGSATRSRRGENSGGNPAGGAGAPGKTTSFYQVGFDASWEIDVFGGVARGVEAAEADIVAAQEDRRDALVSLIAEVARQYVELRGSQRRLAIARQNIQTQQDSVELASVRNRAGLTSELDVAQAQALLASTQAQLPALERDIQQAIHRIGVLLGQEPGAMTTRLQPEGPIPVMVAPVPLGLPSDLLRRRPDIRRSEREVAAITARIGVAVADLYPKFSLTGSAGLESISTGDLLDGGSRFWSIGPTVRWPIFNAGKIRAAVDVQDARQEQSLARYERTVLTAFEEVENALLNYKKENTRFAALARAVEADRKAVSLSQELYTKGLGTFLAVLDAQRSLLEGEDQLAQSQKAVAASLVALHKVLGGGWE